MPVINWHLRFILALGLWLAQHAHAETPWIAVRREAWMVEPEGVDWHAARTGQVRLAPGARVWARVQGAARVHALDEDSATDLHHLIAYRADPNGLLLRLAPFQTKPGWQWYAPTSDSDDAVWMMLRNEGQRRLTVAWSHIHKDAVEPPLRRFKIARDGDSLRWRHGDAIESVWRADRVPNPDQRNADEDEKDDIVAWRGLLERHHAPLVRHPVWSLNTESGGNKGWEWRAFDRTEINRIDGESLGLASTAVMPARCSPLAKEWLTEPLATTQALQALRWRGVFSARLRDAVQAEILDQAACDDAQHHARWLAQLAAGQHPDLAMRTWDVAAPANESSQLTARRMHGYQVAIDVTGGTARWRVLRPRTFAHAVPKIRSQSRPQAQLQAGDESQRAFAEIDSTHPLRFEFHDTGAAPILHLQVLPGQFEQAVELLLRSPSGREWRYRVEPSVNAAALRSNDVADAAVALHAPSRVRTQVFGASLVWPEDLRRGTLELIEGERAWVWLGQSHGRHHQLQAAALRARLQHESSSRIASWLLGATEGPLAPDLAAALQRLRTLIQTRAPVQGLDASSHVASIEALQSLKRWQAAWFNRWQVGQWSTVINADGLANAQAQVNAGVVESWVFESFWLRAWLREDRVDPSLGRALAQYFLQRGDEPTARLIATVSDPTQAWIARESASKDSTDQTEHRQNVEDEAADETLILPRVSASQVVLWHRDRHLPRRYDVARADAAVELELPQAGVYRVEARAWSNSPVIAVEINGRESHFMRVESARTRQWLASHGEAVGISTEVMIRQTETGGVLRLRPLQGVVLLRVQGPRIETQQCPHCQDLPVHARLVEDDRHHDVRVPLRVALTSESSGVNRASAFERAGGDWLCAMDSSKPLKRSEARDWLRMLQGDARVRDVAMAECANELSILLEKLTGAPLRTEHAIAEERLALPVGERARASLGANLLPPGEAVGLLNAARTRWQVDAAKPQPWRVRVMDWPMPALDDTELVVKQGRRVLTSTRLRSGVQSVAIPVGNGGDYQVEVKPWQNARWVMVQSEGLTPAARARFQWVDAQTPFQLHLKQDEWLRVWRWDGQQLHSHVQFAPAGAWTHAPSKAVALRVERLAWRRVESKPNATPDAIVSNTEATRIASAEFPIEWASDSETEALSKWPGTFSLGARLVRRDDTDEVPGEQALERFTGVGAQWRHRLDNSEWWHRASAEIRLHRNAPEVLMLADRWVRAPTDSPWQLFAEAQSFTQADGISALNAEVGGAYHLEFNRSHRHRLTLRGFARHIEGVQLEDDFSVIDADLASQYRLTHQHGAAIDYAARWRHRLDGEWIFDAGLRSNPFEQSTLLDQWFWRGGYRAWWRGTSAQIDWRQRHWRIDEGRARAITRGEWHLGLDGVSLRRRGHHHAWFVDLTRGQGQPWFGQIGWRFDFGPGRNLRDFAPDEWAFRDLHEWRFGGKP